MTTVIFVHGTGGRKDSYAVTFQQIEATLNDRKPEIKLVPCLWGEPLGTKLKAGGVSIPNYDSTRSNKKEDDRVRLWDKLYRTHLRSFP